MATIVQKVTSVLSVPTEKLPVLAAPIISMNAQAVYRSAYLVRLIGLLICLDKRVVRSVVLLHILKEEQLPAHVSVLIETF